MHFPTAPLPPAPEPAGELRGVSPRPATGPFHEALELARAGAISVHTEIYTLDEAPQAYERLHHGHINGRAVVVPNG